VLFTTADSAVHQSQPKTTGQVHEPAELA